MPSLSSSREISDASPVLAIHHLSAFPGAELSEKLKIDDASDVVIMLPAGGNSAINVGAAEAMVRRIRAGNERCTVRVVVRADRADLPAVPEGEEPRSDAVTLASFPHLENLRRTCEELGVTCVPLVQDRINSELEMRSAVAPWDPSLEIGSATHLLVTVHAYPLAQRMRRGAESGIAERASAGTAADLPRRIDFIIHNKGGVPEQVIEGLSNLHSGTMHYVLGPDAVKQQVLEPQSFPGKLQRLAQEVKSRFSALMQQFRPGSYE